MRFSFSFLCALAGGLWGAAAASSPSLSSALSAHPSFSMLHDVLLQHGLLDVLDAARNSTYFAPNNDALRYLADFGFNLSSNPEVARALVNYGLVDGIYSTESIVSSKGSQLVRSSLFPPLFSNVTQGQAVKLHANTTGPSPTLLLETGLQILTHVVEPVIAFKHGLIHGTSTNMVLPEGIANTTRLTHLTEFLRLMQVSGVEESLESLADVTLFIPHDGAIRGMGAVLDLLTPCQLAAVIAHHAVPNHVLYGSTVGDTEQTLKTMDGSKLRVRRGRRDILYVNDVEIVRPDVLLYGGVAHIVDGVLLPAKDTLLPLQCLDKNTIAVLPSPAGRFRNFWQAFSRTNLFFLVGGLLATGVLSAKLYQLCRSSYRAWLFRTAMKSLFEDEECLDVQTTTTHQADDTWADAKRFLWQLR